MSVRLSVFQAGAFGLLLLPLASAPGRAQAPLPGTGFVPPFEIMRTVRWAGFDPLAPPMREGTTYVLRATDFRGILMRVVVDAHSGAIRDVTRIVSGPGSSGPVGMVSPPYDGSPTRYEGPTRFEGPTPYGAPEAYGAPEFDDPEMMPGDESAMPPPPPLSRTPGPRTGPRLSAPASPPLPRPRPANFAARNSAADAKSDIKDHAKLGAKAAAKPDAKQSANPDVKADVKTDATTTPPSGPPVAPSKAAPPAPLND